MDNERSQRRFESVYSKKVRAGKRRTYFFDVRKTKGDDFYLTLTESTKKFNGDGYERHKIFLYKEDFNRFIESLEEAINHVKTELMPDYDYDEYTRRHEEYEALKASNEYKDDKEEDASDEQAVSSESDSPSLEAGTDEDMSW
ncbi:MAG: PUR family DNA/RNA-binding protein [Chitinophagales bacterium]|nr:PUR family DNA/RNA-binding protein [Chitinophagales bacterium]